MNLQGNTVRCKSLITYKVGLINECYVVLAYTTPWSYISNAIGVWRTIHVSVNNELAMGAPLASCEFLIDNLPRQMCSVRPSADASVANHPRQLRLTITTYRIQGVPGIAVMREIWIKQGTVGKKF